MDVEKRDWTLVILAGSANVYAGNILGACTLSARFLGFPPLLFEGKVKIIIKNDCFLFPLCSMYP